MLFTFILVVQAIIAAALVTVILMQRSEGGGLAGGGSPAGLMSARGAADFLTRTTAILATLFVGLSVVLAVIASLSHAPTKIDASLVKSSSGSPANPVGTGASDNPLAAAAQKTAKPGAPGNSTGVPIQH